MELPRDKQGVPDEWQAIERQTGKTTEVLVKQKKVEDTVAKKLYK